MEDVKMLLKFIESHNELRGTAPHASIDSKRLRDSRLVKAIGHVAKVLSIRLLRVDTGAPRIPVLSALEEAGLVINPTRLTPTGWAGGVVQTRVGRIQF